MPASKRSVKTPAIRARSTVRIRFKTETADEIAAKHGLLTAGEKAIFFGVTHHSYSRVVNGRVKPGEGFIAAVLGSHPDDGDITFDALFEVVSP